jgi:hypothetical protein
MSRFLTLSATIALLCFAMRTDAQYEIVELADVKLAKSLSATVQDPAGYPLPRVLVQEFAKDWKTELRTSTTDARGHFSLSTTGRKIYYVQLSAPGFDPLRVRIQVDRKRGANLELKLTIAT